MSVHRIVAAGVAVRIPEHRRVADGRRWSGPATSLFTTFLASTIDLSPASVNEPLPFMSRCKYSVLPCGFHGAGCTVAVSSQMRVGRSAR